VHRFLRPYRRVLVTATVLLLVQTAFVVAEPWPMKLAIDYGLDHEALPDWLGWLEGWSASSVALVAALLSLTLVALAALIGYVTTVLADGAAELIGADIRETAFNRTLQLSAGFHDRTRSAEIVTRLTSDIQRWEDALVAAFTVLVPETLLLAGMLIVLFWLDPVLALVGLLAVPPLVVATLIRRRRLTEMRRAARDARGQLVTYTNELVRNVRAVQVFGQQRAVHDTFAAWNRASADLELASIRQEARFTPSADIILAVGGAVVLWLGVTQIEAGTLTIGSLLVVLTYLGKLYSPVRSLSRLTATFASGRASRERLRELLVSDDVIAEAPDARPAPRFAELDLRGIRFGYAPEHPVLDGVNLRVGRGERVAVVGTTGAGKTTLLSLLLRLHDPDAGAVLLDGVDLRACTLASVRRRITLVPQDAWLMDGTLLANLTFGRPDATPAEIEVAVRSAMLEDTVRRLPLGLETIVGESGAQLSVGQRRRVALARALLRGGSLLLLDEPTSGLDAATEAQVLAAIDAVPASTTVIAVTHRLGLALRSDRVVVLDDGRFIEDGPPAELLRRDGPFARLVAESRPASVRPHWGPPLSARPSRGGEPCPMAAAVTAVVCGVPCPSRPTPDARRIAPPTATPTPTRTPTTDSPRLA
jgi:ABC-type multidrug transport system fused ATPase/permease subunit